MGSLRIYNAPTVGDLGFRLARRRYRDALTGRAIVQAYNKLKDIAENDGIHSLLADLDEVYSDEVQQSGLRQEQISPYLLRVHENAKAKESTNRPNDVIEEFGIDDIQQFEFDLIQETPDLQSIKVFLEGLNIKHLDINNIPLVRCLSAVDLEIAKSRLGLSSREEKKLREYLDRREKVIRENTCLVTKRNRIVLSNDINEIRKLVKWAPIKVVINGLDDPDETQEELESVYECICEGEKDLVRIESTLDDNEILIGYYTYVSIK